MRVDTTAADATAQYLQARTGLLSAGPGGSAARRALAAAADGWLATLFRESGAGVAGAALVAVGGLGRRELAPGSDLDLLLLHPPESDPAALTEAADRLWYPIWDAGFRLDHSVRNPSQARRLAAQDLRVLLGLLDARTIAGDPALLPPLRESVLADWRAFAPERLVELRASVEERAARAGELSYLLEPDLKESHGGLRDVVSLRAVAASWVTDAPLSGLTKPHAFLLDVRDALHLVTGRPSDRLLQQEQPAAAALLGYGDEDALLRAVSSAGRAVTVASDNVWHRVARLQRRSRTPDHRRVRRLGPVGAAGEDRLPLADGVVVQAGEVVLAVGARPERDPVLVLRAAAAAAQSGLRLAPHAVERLGSRSAAMPVPWPPPARDALVSLLGAGRHAIPVWESLDQVGLWERLIPGWAQVRSAPQRNPVHRFTVDRHLLETAVESAARLRTVNRPDLLLVGALLHDIGKGRPGDHTEVGMTTVREIGTVLGFPPSDTDVLVRLVEHHLLLPDVATRRDLDDPATVRAVVDAVRTPDFLDLLSALTEADALATGPAVWSEWKQSLIAELVARTRLGLGVEAPSTPTAGIDEAELLGVLAAGTGGPRDAAGSSRGPEPARSGVQVLLREAAGTGVVTVVVAAPDRPGLLASVAGVLALHRLQVRAARLETLPDGRAVQVWTVSPVFGDPPTVDRLREDVVRELAGTLDVGGRLAARAAASSGAGPVPSAPALVEVVPGASSRSTVVEVRAHDAPGLLHALARAVTSTGADVVAARVSTLGSEVVDVFYLRGPDGVPLTEEAARSVVTALTEVLSPPS